jgi:uncharacterized protein YjgD (DUF1641 family)
MAKPIELMPKINAAQGAREELKRRIDAAPVDHGDAVLDAYELLQQLHESGTLDVLRGLLGAGDEVVRHAVGVAIKPELVAVLRNLLILGRLISDVSPDKLERVLGDVSAALAKEPVDNPPSLFAIFRRFSSVESRRALNAAATVLETVGKGMA